MVGGNVFLFWGACMNFFVSRIGLSAVLIVSFVCSASGFAGERYDALNNDQKKTVDQGKQILIEQPLQSEEIWPTLTLYQRVEATAEEAMAIFSDYALQKEYVHRVIKSLPRVSSSENKYPKTKEIDYKLNVTDVLKLLFNPNYTLRNTISYNGVSQGYTMHWTLVQASSLEKMEGNAWIEPLQGGSSMIVYTNVIVPVAINYIYRSILMTYPVTAAYRRGAGEALQSIVDRINSEKINQPNRVQDQIQTLQNIFDIEKGGVLN